jgi:hypothetical protein
VARRFADGAHFETLAAPEHALSPSTPFHAGLDAAHLLAAPPRRDLVSGLTAFLRPSDVLCVWGPYATDLLREAGTTLPSASLDLRTAARRLLRGKVGSLEHYAATLGTAPPPFGAGRAGRRMALLGQVVAAWQPIVALPIE